MKNLFATKTVLLLFLAAFLAAGAASSLTPEVAAADENAAERSAAYRDARRALDQSRWMEAVEGFGKVIQEGGNDVDAAYYWSAYANYKAGRADAATEALRTLRRKYQDSEWSDDARALEAEIRQASTGRVEVPENDQDELKLLALSSLMRKDPETALDYLLKFLGGDASPEPRRRALFLLSQSELPRAQEIYLEIARGRRNPDLQLAAVRNLGFSDSGSPEILSEIYRTTSNPEVKRTVLHAYGDRGMVEELLKVYRGEKDEDLRTTVAQALGMAGASDKLRALYKEEASAAVRGQILQATARSGDFSFVVEIVKSEKDPKLRRQAIRVLGIQGGEEAGALLREMYGRESDLEVKQTILDSLLHSGATPFLMEVAHGESNPALRSRALRNLAMSGSDEVWPVFDEIYAKADLETKKSILRAYALGGQIDRVIAIARSASDPELKKEAVRSLTFSDSEKATQYLLSLLADE